MSEEKLKQILQEVADGEMSLEEAFDEISWCIVFEPPYEGE